MTATRFSLAPITSIQIHFPSGADFQLKPWPSPLDQIEVTPATKPHAVRLACRRLAVQLDTPLLHLEIRTPFGEVATDTLVESALQTALGPHMESYALHGWHVLRVEDTHVGSVHRVLATLEDNLNPWEKAPLVDYQVPIELGLCGLGNHLGQGQVGNPWQLLLAFGGKIYSALFSGTDTYHIRSWPKQHPLVQSQIQEHGANLLKALGSKEKSWQQILGPGCREFLIDPGSAIGQETQTRRAALSFFPNLSGFKGDEEKANLALWSIGLGEAMKNPESLPHNQIPAESQLGLRNRRMRRVFAISSMISVVSLFVCASALAAHYRIGLTDIRILQERAQGYSQQVEALNGLRSTIASKQDSIQALGQLARREFPVSLLLSEVAKASGNTEIQGFHLKTSDQGGYEAYLRAFTSQWENVESFRRHLNQAPGITQTEVLEQRKDAGKGKVFFDIRAWAQRP